MSRRAKLQAALQNGEQLTVKQMVARFGYTGGNCARKDVTRIRDRGVPIGRLYDSKSKAGARFLVVGSPRPAIVVQRI